MEDVDARDVPPVVRAWVAQLLDPGFLAFMRAYPAEQIDVRLSASRGKVRPKPALILNGGPSELVEP